ncbi:conserved hypothetical protein [Methylovorus sp. MP688]|nr:conserved hypothetical protein [Methylovorus sp. MP688]
MKSGPAMNTEPAAAPRPAKRRLHSRFDHDDEDPRASLVNLVDVMLVFACGLLAALSAGGQAMIKPAKELERGREIAAPPSVSGNPGSGYQSVGQVYRDEKTGKLLLIEQANPSAQTKQPAQPSVSPQGTAK